MFECFWDESRGAHALRHTRIHMIRYAYQNWENETWFIRLNPFVSFKFTCACNLRCCWKFIGLLDSSFNTIKSPKWSCLLYIRAKLTCSAEAEVSFMNASHQKTYPFLLFDCTSMLENVVKCNWFYLVYIQHQMLVAMLARNRIPLNYV